MPSPPHSRQIVRIVAQNSETVLRQSHYKISWKDWIKLNHKERPQILDYLLNSMETLGHYSNGGFFGGYFYQ